MKWHTGVGQKGRSKPPKREKDKVEEAARKLRSWTEDANAAPSPARDPNSFASQARPTVWRMWRYTPLCEHGFSQSVNGVKSSKAVLGASTVTLVAGINMLLSSFQWAGTQKPLKGQLQTWSRENVEEQLLLTGLCSKQVETEKAFCLKTNLGPPVVPFLTPFLVGRVPLNRLQKKKHGYQLIEKPLKSGGPRNNQPYGPRGPHGIGLASCEVHLGCREARASANPGTQG